MLRVIFIRNILPLRAEPSRGAAAEAKFFLNAKGLDLNFTLGVSHFAERRFFFLFDSSECGAGGVRQSENRDSSRFINQLYWVNLITIYNGRHGTMARRVSFHDVK